MQSEVNEHHTQKAERRKEGPHDAKQKSRSQAEAPFSPGQPENRDPERGILSCSGAKELDL